jgi:hypothetical protein
VAYWPTPETQVETLKDNSRKKVQPDNSNPGISVRNSNPDVSARIGFWKKKYIGRVIIINGVHTRFVLGTAVINTSHTRKKREYGEATR